MRVSSLTNYRLTLHFVFRIIENQYDTIMADCSASAGVLTDEAAAGRETKVWTSGRNRTFIGPNTNGLKQKWKIKAETIRKIKQQKEDLCIFFLQTSLAL